MALTDAQKTTLKAYIEGDATLNAYPNTLDGAFAIADALNVDTATFIVWKTDLPTKTCKTAMVWTEYIGRSDAERDAWQFMLSNGTINPSDINVRQGIQDIFSGPNGASTRAALVAIAKRSAMLIEQIFATGTGTSADPATMTREGTINYQDVYAARNYAG